MAMTLMAVIALLLVPPYSLGPAVPIAVGLVLGTLLVALMVADPGRIDSRSQQVRRLSLTLVGFLLLATLGSTVLLVYDLLSGAAITDEATPLLLAGAKVWLGNNVAFAFLYWQLDRGGPGERAYRSRPFPDLAFPQDQGPELAPPGWRPQFWDYLYVAFTTASAFSPTDTMPLTHRAKGAMGTQALISFAIVGLVIARAVGIFA